MALFEGSEEVIKAITHLVEVMVASFGAFGTVVIFLILFLVAFLWRRYNDWQKDKTTNALLAEKERTIQRLAEEARNFKILFLKHQLGWTDAEIDLFIMKNEFEDAVAARKALEGEPSVIEGESSVSKGSEIVKKKKRSRR